MATNQIPLQGPFGANVFVDSDADETASDAITGGAKTVYVVDINNTSAEKVYTKLYNNAAPSVGSTAVDGLFPCAAGSTIAYAIPDGLNYDTNVSVACVQEAGDAGTTGPSSVVTVKLLTN